MAERAGAQIMDLVAADTRPSDIMTRDAFENAIAVAMAFGGSTNVVLHLLAIAREAEVDLTIDDFNRIGDRIPHIGDLKPFGKYVMNDVDKVQLFRTSDVKEGVQAFVEGREPTFELR